MMAAFGVLVVALGLTPLWPVFQTPEFVITVVAGSVLGAAVAAIVTRRRWPWWTLPIGLVLVFAVTGVPLAVPQQALWRVFPSLGGEQALFLGAVEGWKQIVTITPPVGSFGALLVPVFMLSLVGSALAVVLAAAVTRRALALVPGIVVTGVAIWLGLADARFAVISGAVIAVTVLVALLSATPGGVLRKLTAIGATVFVGAVAAGVALSMTAPPEVWRSRVSPTLDEASLPSPLSAFRAYEVGDLAEVPMFSVSNATTGEMLTLATLSRYDGVSYSVWTPDGDFTRQSGYALADGVDPDAAEITIEQLTGPWLPLRGDLAGMQTIGTGIGSLYFSPTAQTAIDLNGLSQGFRYRVSGPGIEPSNLARLATATPGTDRTVVTDEPAGVQAYVATHSEASAEPGERLVAVLGSLLQNGYVSNGGADEPPSRSGHSAERITSLLTDKLMIGDAEQYSVAAALLAQQVGFPARVAVGFVVPENATEIIGSQLSAWVEVNTSDGWVAIDPVPESRPIPDAPPDDPNRVSPPQSVVDPPPADVSQVRGAQAPQSDEEADIDDTDPLWGVIFGILRALAAVVAVGALLLLPPLCIVVAKAWRRRRRQSGGNARQRIMGARDQAADVLIDARYVVTASTTNRELVSNVQVPDAPQLAFLIDRAEYTADPLVAADARNAWLVVSDLENELMTGLTRRQRLARRLALWSFIGRRARR
jgi:hypothetical protein